MTTTPATENRTIRPPRIEHERSRPQRAILALALGAAVGALAWLRLPAIARDTLWAEDGRNFLQSALSGHVDLFAPYGGYLHLMPRLIAHAAVATVPVEGYALFMSAATSLVAGLCGALVWITAQQHVRPAWALLLAASTVLAPLAAREVLGNAANLHTVLMWTLFWVLLYTPVRRSTAILLALFTACAALTEVQAVFLAPLAIWRFRDRVRRIVVAGFGIGVGGQLACALLSSRKQTGFGHVDAVSYPYGFAINAVMPLALDTRAIGPVLAATGPLVPLLLVAVIAVVLIALLRRRTRRAHMIAAAALALGVLVFVAGVHTTPLDLYDYAHHSPDELRRVWLARYGVLPSQLILAALCVAAGSAGRPQPPRARAFRAALATALAAAILLSFVLHFTPADTRRSRGPAWQPQVGAARADCARGADEVVLHQTLGWTVRIPCERLR